MRFFSCDVAVKSAVRQVVHRRHTFVALARNGVKSTKQFAVLGIPRDQARVERADSELVAHDGNAAVVGAAAVGGNGTHLVFGVPILSASDGMQPVHMVAQVVTFTMPSTTMGAVSIDSNTSVSKMKVGLSLPTLSVLICSVGQWCVCSQFMLECKTYEPSLLAAFNWLCDTEMALGRSDPVGAAVPAISDCAAAWLVMKPTDPATASKRLAKPST